VSRSKLVVIVGQTSSGKSDLAVTLAKKFNGEIISADSRQVYKELNLASGKITKKEMDGVRHHLLDLVSLKTTYTVAQYQKQALKEIKNIYKRKKIPFLVGGSAFYIYSVIDNLNFPKATINLKLRKQLNKLSAEILFSRLQKLDPERATSIESKNPRRLIRALEIIDATNSPIEKQQTSPSPFSNLLIGIKKTPKELHLSIEKRLEKRLNQGMVSEIEKLHKKGISYKRLEELGLEARYVALFLQNKISKEKMKKQIFSTTVQFSKRQLTWFKKDKRITWISKPKEAKDLVRKFL